MPAISQSDIDLILAAPPSGAADSNLGFFSKPFRINYKDGEFILKKYLPVRNQGLVDTIIQNHNRYINELRNVGINIPETIVKTVRIKRKVQIFIIQEAFRKGELLRNLIEISSDSDLLKLCKLILDDSMKFRNCLNGSMEIGFHPTLRNYALRDGSLFYFDTFPPMLMNQREVNRIIIKMSPYGNIVKSLIPLRWINIVSNEYYDFKKMFIGIVGSCCRLRPEYADSILKFSTDYINNSSCSPEEKQKITEILESPPDLPALWTFFRKISGNVGKPNIKKARNK